ncbi:MAG TPA: nucleotidyltransferase domain-containing protein [Polyangiaceae bacterium]
MSTQQSPIEKLELVSRANWTHIHQARLDTTTKLAELVTLLGEDLPAPDSELTLVLFGSLARRELTTKSDIDWTLLVDGPTSPDHFVVAQDIRQASRRVNRLNLDQKVYSALWPLAMTLFTKSVEKTIRIEIRRDEC